MTHYLHGLRDGRNIGVSGLGDPAATRLVLFCHPSPGSGGFDPDPRVTASIGVRVISLDRPGYGGTDVIDTDAAAESHTSMEVWLADVDEYLRSIESNAMATSVVDFGRIGVIGWGAGAMFASVFAARYPELVERLALVEPTAPTEERLTQTSGAVDDRLENEAAVAGLARHPGAADRLQFMLDDVRGDAGMLFDRAALDDATWNDSLRRITAEALIVSSGMTADDEWYQQRIGAAAGSAPTISSEWTATGTSIVEAWPTVLAFMQPRESPQAVDYSDRRSSSPFPQVSRRLE